MYITLGNGHVSLGILKALIIEIQELPIIFFMKLHALPALNINAFSFQPPTELQEATLTSIYKA